MVEQHRGDAVIGAQEGNHRQVGIEGAGRAQYLTVVETIPADGSVPEQHAAVGAPGRLIADREAALAKKLAEMRHRKRALVDPLQYAMSVRDPALAAYQPALPAEMGAPSPQQISALAKAGIFPEEINSAGHASELLNKLRERKEKGLTQPRQIRCLERYGLKDVGSMPYEQAQRLIARIAANGWRLPYDMRT